MSTVVSDVIDQALRLANRVDPNYRVRALDAVDRAVRQYAEKLPWPSLDRTEVFTSDGSRLFTFPRRVRVPVSVGDVGRGENVRPGNHWERQYPRSDMGLETAGQGIWQWQDKGEVAVLRQPAAPTLLEFSTTQSDAIPVYVSGLVFATAFSGTADEYYEASELVAANVTAVDSVNQYSKVLRIEKDRGFTSADVLVRYATGDLPAARLLRNERRSHYHQIQFLGTPSVGAQFQVRYYAEPPRITAENVVLDPSIDEDALVWFTVGDLHWMAQAPEAANAAWAKALARIDEKLTARQGHGDRAQQAIPADPWIDYCDDTYE